MMSREKMKVLAGSVLGMIVTIGIARFAYTPMIPEMARDISLSESVAGYLAAANYAGYLAGAFLIARIQRMSLKVRLYRLALIGAVITTVAMGYTEQITLWYLLRFLSGLSSAAGVLLGAGLLMHWLLQRKQKAELGVFFSGLGSGIVLTALISELISSRLPWDTQWVIYGIAALVLSVPVWRWMPDNKESDSGLPAPVLSNNREGRFMLALQSAYFCAGVGYVVTATFLVAIAQATPQLAESSSLIWLLVGLSAAAGCALWDLYLRYVGEWSAMLQAYLLNTLSILMLLAQNELWLVMLSAVLYGASFIGIVSMTLALVGRRFPENPSRPMSKLTFSYGLAQMLAPAITGFLAEQQGNYQQGLVLTALVMVIGTLLLPVAIRYQRRETCTPDLTQTDSTHHACDQRSANSLP